MKRKSKKGLTLIEVILSASFIVVIMAAAAAAIILSYKAFAVTTFSTDTYLNAQAVENELRTHIKNTESVKVLAPDAPAPNAYKLFTIRNKKLISPDNADIGIEDIKISIKRADGGVRLDYVITASGTSGYKYDLDGGIVLNNLKADQLKTDGVLSDGINETALLSLKDIVLFIK